jgi:uncharacterized protein (TIGR02246 family)
MRNHIEDKQMTLSQTYRVASMATHTIDSTQKPKSGLRHRMQRLILAILTCAIAFGPTASTSVAQSRDEAAIRALGDGFAKEFVQKNAEGRASLFAENGTFVTPQGDYLQGRVAMVKDFGSEAQAINGSTQAAFSNYRVRFVKSDVAVVDAVLTVHNVNGPDGQVIPVIPINFFYVAVHHGDHWLIEDGRAHFAPAPANAMTSRP